MVTTGAAAALTLAAAASMTRWDIARMAALPHADGFPNEILLPRTHYTGYAHALRASGARLVDLGHNDRGTGAGVRGIEPWEIEAAITPRTAAFAFSANPVNIQDLTVVAAVCKAAGIPVIVDAAAQLPPKSNLRSSSSSAPTSSPSRAARRSAARRPRASSPGRRDLVGAALVQQLDMDVSPETWTPPDLIDRDALKGVPHHGLGRGFKAGKEEIVGLLVALERFCRRGRRGVERRRSKSASHASRKISARWSRKDRARTRNRPRAAASPHGRKSYCLERSSPGGRAARAPLRALRCARHPGRRSAGIAAGG